MCPVWPSSPTPQLQLKVQLQNDVPIIWTIAELLSSEHFETKFSESLIEIQYFASMKMHLKIPVAEQWTFSLDLNVFNTNYNALVKINAGQR